MSQQQQLIPNNSWFSYTPYSAAENKFDKDIHGILLLFIRNEEETYKIAKLNNYNFIVKDSDSNIVKTFSQIFGNDKILKFLEFCEIIMNPNIKISDYYFPGIWKNEVHQNLYKECKKMSFLYLGILHPFHVFLKNAIIFKNMNQINLDRIHTTNLNFDIEKFFIYKFYAKKDIPKNNNSTKIYFPFFIYDPSEFNDVTKFNSYEIIRGIMNECISIRVSNKTVEEKNDLLKNQLLIIEHSGTDVCLDFLEKDSNKKIFIMERVKKTEAKAKLQQYSKAYRQIFQTRERVKLIEILSFRNFFINLLFPLFYDENIGVKNSSENLEQFIGCHVQSQRGSRLPNDYLINSLEIFKDYPEKREEYNKFLTRQLVIMYNEYKEIKPHHNKWKIEEYENKNLVKILINYFLKKQNLFIKNNEIFAKKINDFFYDEENLQNFHKKIEENIEKLNKNNFENFKDFEQNISKNIENRERQAIILSLIDDPENYKTINGRFKFRKILIEIAIISDNTK